jgi:membrane protein DedA with SNARE-associated domain
MLAIFVSTTSSKLGYLTLALLIGGESAGLPLPGETALIAGGILASQEKLGIEQVILWAAVAAIVGDNIGYVLGRKGARRLLQRPGWMEDRRRELLARGEAYFTRHGGKTVFFGRWLPFLRITAAWLAGAHHMPWPRFFFFNAAGGISWAFSVGLLAYFAAGLAEAIVRTTGYVVLGLVALAVFGLGVWLFRRWATARANASGGST